MKTIVKKPYVVKKLIIVIKKPILRLKNNKIKKLSGFTLKYGKFTNKNTSLKLDILPKQRKATKQHSHLLKREFKRESFMLLFWHTDKVIIRIRLKASFGTFQTRPYLFHTLTVRTNIQRNHSRTNTITT